MESIVQSLDNSVLEAAKGGGEQGDSQELDAAATVSIPLALVRQLLALQEEIGKVREKHAKKEARAKAQGQADDADQGDDQVEPGQGDGSSSGGVLFDDGGDGMPDVNLATLGAIDDHTPQAMML